MLNVFFFFWRGKLQILKQKLFLWLDKLTECFQYYFNSHLPTFLVAVKSNSPRPTEEEKKEKVPQSNESAAEPEKDIETKMEH